MRIRNAALCLLFLLGRQVHAHAAPSGPIEVGNQYPLTLSHLSFSAQSAEILPENDSKFGVTTVWTNTSFIEDHYVVDSESLLLNFASKWSFTGNLEFSLELPVLWQGGGRLDSTIDGYHQTLGFPQGDRPELDTNAFEVSGEDSQGNAFLLQTDGMNLVQPIFGFKYGLFSNLANETNLAALLKFSTPRISGSYGNNGADVLLGALYTTRLSDSADWYVHSGLSWIYFSDTNQSGLNFESNHGEGFSSLEYCGIQGISLSAALIFSGKVMNDIQGHPDYSVYLDTGAKIGIGEGYTLDLLLRENPAPSHGTTDVSFLLGMSKNLD